MKISKIQLTMLQMQALFNLLCFPQIKLQGWAVISCAEVNHKSKKGKQIQRGKLENKSWKLE